MNISAFLQTLADILSESYGVEIEPLQPVATDSIEEVEA